MTTVWNGDVMVVVMLHAAGGYQIWTLASAIA